MRLTWLVALLLGCANVLAATGSGEPSCAKNFIVLRKGPATSFPVSWRAARYMPFFRHEAKGAWVRVTDLEGESHWAQPRDLTSAYPCVAVKAMVATLRKEPTLAAPPADLKTVDRYTPLKKLETPGEWVKIEDETGRRAWIHESNIWKPMKVQSVKF